MGEGVGVDSRLVIFQIYFVVGCCCCEDVVQACVVYKKTSKVRMMHHCMCFIAGVGMLRVQRNSTSVAQARF